MPAPCTHRVLTQHDSPSLSTPGCVMPADTMLLLGLLCNHRQAIPGHMAPHCECPAACRTVEHTLQKQSRLKAAARDALRTTEQANFQAPVLGHNTHRGPICLCNTAQPHCAPTNKSGNKRVPAGDSAWELTTIVVLRLCTPLGHHRGPTSRLWGCTCVGVCTKWCCVYIQGRQSRETGNRQAGQHILAGCLSSGTNAPACSTPG